MRGVLLRMSRSRCGIALCNGRIRNRGDLLPARSGAVGRLGDGREDHCTAAVRALAFMTYLLPLVAQPAATPRTAEMGIHLLRRRSSSDVNPDANGDDEGGSDAEDYWVVHRLRPCLLLGFFPVFGSITRLVVAALLLRLADSVFHSSDNAASGDDLAAPIAHPQSEKACWRQAEKPEPGSHALRGLRACHPPD